MEGSAIVLDEAHKEPMRTRGFTLVEVLVGTALLVGAGGALLVGMNSAMLHASYLEQEQLALNAAAAKLQALTTTNFDTLLTGAQYALARTALGQCSGLNEDLNCNGALDLGEDANNNGTLDEPIPGAHLTMRIKSNDPLNPADPGIVDITVTVTWIARGRRVGEDVNDSGFLDAGEDTDGNGVMSSPIMLTTKLSRPL